MKNTSKENRQFGIEIELTGINTYEAASAISRAGIECQAEHYNHSTRRTWKVVTDSSVTSPRGQRGGTEVVSPILKGIEGFKQVATVLEALKNAGGKVDRSCGIHVHIDANDFTVDDIKKICYTYERYNDVIDNLQPKSRRENQNIFCGRFEDTKWMQIENATTIYEMTSGSRYYNVNLTSYMRHGTVEFRQSASSLEAAKVLSWIQLILTLVDVARATRKVEKQGKKDLSTMLRKCRRYGMDSWVAEYLTNRYNHFKTETRVAA